VDFLLCRGLITAIATFQKEGASGGTYFIGFIVVCVATGFVLCALGDFFMLAKVFMQFFLWYGTVPIWLVGILCD